MHAAGPTDECWRLEPRSPQLNQHEALGLRADVGVLQGERHKLAPPPFRSLRHRDSVGSTLSASGSAG